MTTPKLINCSLSSLIGKNVAGIIAQVTNPRYINGAADVHPKYRTITELKTFKENGKNWITLHWERQDGDSCDFTGCTLTSDSCTIQLTSEELSKMNKQTMANN